MAQSSPTKVLFGAFSLIGNLFWLVGFAYLFQPTLVSPYIPLALSEIISQYPQSSLALFVSGIFLTVIPSLFKFMNKLDKSEPTQQQAAEKQRIDKLLQTDPVALKTQWTPVSSGGFSGRSARLVSTNNNLRINTNITKSTIFASLSTLVFFTGLFGFITYGLLITEGQGTLWFIIAIDLIFVGASIYSLVKLSTPMVFDKSNGWFWRGYGLGDDIDKIRRDKRSLQLSDIYALQVMREQVQENKSSYISHELNLVLKDGSRHNILDHADEPTLLSDAQLLAGFLNVDIWQKDNE
jgi:hypothetical protein